MCRPGPLTAAAQANGSSVEGAAVIKQSPVLAAARLLLAAAREACPLSRPPRAPLRLLRLREAAGPAGRQHLRGGRGRRRGVCIQLAAVRFGQRSGRASAAATAEGAEAVLLRQMSYRRWRGQGRLLPRRRRLPPAAGRAGAKIGSAIGNAAAGRH